VQRRPLRVEENRERFPEDDPRHHTKRIRDMLSEARDHLREDIGKINEPRAEALFETTAETLDRLITAFEDYERGQEEAWRDDA
jgi:chromosome segregation ATPase